MKVRVTVSVNEGYGNDFVNVEVGEVIVGGDFKTDVGTTAIVNAIESLVDEAQGKAFAIAAAVANLEQAKVAA